MSARDGSAMPVGPEPQASEVERLRAHSEFLMRDVLRLRARVAELEAARNGSRPDGHSHPEADDVTPQVQKLRALLAEQRAVVSEPLEDPHNGPLAHRYALGRDLPQTGGAQ